MNKIEIIASIMGLLWTLFKTSSWWEMRRNAKITRIYEALEVGVQVAWEQVVKPFLRESGKDTPLPSHVREEAERVAIGAAEKADKIIRKVPCETLRATLKMAVEEAKRRGAK